MTTPTGARRERLEQFLSDVRTHKKPYETTVRGLNLLVYPQHVLSPKYCHASHFMADVVAGKNLAGKRVLEVGTGSGLQSVIAAAQAGAGEVIALDINPYAVLNARDNFMRHKVNGEVRLSDVFSAVSRDEKFDLIMFEAPYHDFTPQSFLERGVADEGYKALKRFFRQADRHLTKRGELLVGFSPYYGDFAMLQNTISANGYKVLNHHHDVLQNRSWSVLHLRK